MIVPEATMFTVQVEASSTKKCEVCCVWVCERNKELSFHTSCCSQWGACICNIEGKDVSSLGLTLWAHSCLCTLYVFMYLTGAHVQWLKNFKSETCSLWYFGQISDRMERNGCSGTQWALSKWLVLYSFVFFGDVITGKAFRFVSFGCQ